MNGNTSSSSSSSSSSCCGCVVVVVVCCCCCSLCCGGGAPEVHVFLSGKVQRKALANRDTTSCLPRTREAPTGGNEGGRGRRAGGMVLGLERAHVNYHC